MIARNPVFQGNWIFRCGSHGSNLTNLTALSLSDNPLTSPVKEIVQQGAQAILAYLREQF